MPNWVFNTVTVSGDKHALNSFVERAGKSYTMKTQKLTSDGFEWTEQEVNEPLSFWNFVRPEDSILDEYFGNEREGLSLEERLKHNTNHWYDWNIRNWGCKWDASDAYVQDLSDDDTSCHLEFNTPWGPPIEAFRAMAGLYPELNFEFHYAEEQGWGGIIEGRQGGLFVMKEWDIPQTHEERMDSMGWCYCEEMRDDELEDTFDDCPRKMEMASV
jgi:hypothetical protein